MGKEQWARENLIASERRFAQAGYEQSHNSLGFDFQVYEGKSFLHEGGESVLQREWGITDAGSDKPIIGTDGIGPCVAVVLYARKEKKAVLAHIDLAADLDSLDDIIKENFDGLNIVETHLYGAEYMKSDASNELFANEYNKMIDGRVDEIAGRLSAHAHLELKSSTVCLHEISSCFAFDSRTGMIVPSLNIMDEGSDLEFRKERGQRQENGVFYPLEKAFDGTAAAQGGYAEKYKNNDSYVSLVSGTEKQERGK
jgi:hypothetical protein